ncbi:GTPase Era [Parenemella sanctibonifatiensis]|uniref:GTPase Era n=1 Tax=Parenemella sanctibonifatiensis TaxID=2016505 RepID=A0A255EQU4_9ACTN|nr:GTPase Era [Parenemella sanctibonifatiensis]OYN91975.1 GTPase Era [Parenemella sanctibonifatiensis]
MTENQSFEPDEAADRDVAETDAAPTDPLAAYEGFRSGFLCFVGRPNAGKSTLTNALVGEKIAIASDKPQTTRHAVRGVVNRPGAQLVVVDTPGLHRPRTLLGERLNDLVRDTWSEVDVVAVCLPASQRIGPGDTYLVQQLAELDRTPTLVAVATKSDLVSPERMMKHLVAIQQLEAELGIRWEQIIPVSAVTDDQVDVVLDEVIKLLPEGPPLYPDDVVTDEPVETRIAELIREAALAGVREELPHSLVVQIDEMGLREDRPEDKPLMDVHASLVVERDSQKGIVIGHRGARLKEVGTAARKEISALLGMPVHLALHVKVLKEWQRNPKYLNRLGF